MKDNLVLICDDCEKIDRTILIKNKEYCKKCSFKYCLECGVSLPWNRPKWKRKCLTCYTKYKLNDNRKCRIICDSD